jgi:ABC-type multidrug transport system fused ATPase/permease subunit
MAFETQRFQPINSSEIFIGILFYVALNAVLTLLTAAYPENPPYFVMQILNNFSALTFVMSIWFFALTLINRKNKFFASLLFIYLFYELTKVILGLTGRTWFFIHMLGLFFLYHRIVKPFSRSQIFYLFFLALATFLFFGYIRTGQTSILSIAGFFTGNEEFSSLFATSYDLKIRLQNMPITETVPFSVKNFDYIALIPSQFLPFEKIDGPSWYVTLIGLQGTGYGAGFGVISQALVGFGKVELILRGILIGFIFASLHRFVTQKQISIWRLVIYTYFAIQSYHIMRNGTGYLLYFFVYFILPCLFVLKFFTFSSKRFSKADN